MAVSRNKSKHPSRARKNDDMTLVQLQKLAKQNKVKYSGVKKSVLKARLTKAGVNLNVKSRSPARKSRSPARKSRSPARKSRSPARKSRSKSRKPKSKTRKTRKSKSARLEAKILVPCAKGQDRDRVTKRCRLKKQAVRPSKLQE